MSETDTVAMVCSTRLHVANYPNGAKDHVALVIGLWICGGCATYGVSRESLRSGPFRLLTPVVRWAGRCRTMVHAVSSSGSVNLSSFPHSSVTRKSRFPHGFC